LTLLGAFFLIGGTYAVAQLINDAYAAGQIGKSSQFDEKLASG
jgi:hypothetical protein